ncbi:DMT family transporter [Roseibium sp.]|uniref:DMT family transporter n=1 Tax=Roseibium sp. TaxID=1936156 RepID=UPI003D116B2A
MALSDNLRGAALMAASMTAFTINDMFVKLLGDHLPFFQFLLLRSIGASALLFLLARRAGAVRWPEKPKDRWLIALRSLAEMAAAYFFLTALIHMPIANVTAILQALPLTVALGASLFLGEAVGWRRFLAIGLGFIGVFLIVRPGPGGFPLYALYALLAVAAVTVRDLAARRLSPQVPSLTVALAAASTILVFSAIGAISSEWEPLRPTDWLWLSGSVLSILGGYLFSVSAMRVGEIGFVAQFRYSSLLVALLIGLLVFGEWPDTVTLAGAAIVVATGLFTIWRERTVKSATVQAPRRL